MDVKFNTEDVKVYIAGAGSGKTFALMSEMSELLKTYRPDEIAFTTFTRKGVQTGIERALKDNTDLKAEDLPYFQTLHKMCFRESGLKRVNILEPKDIKLFNELTNFNLALRSGFEYNTDDSKLLQRYDAERSGSKTGLYIHMKYDEERYERLVNAYCTFKVENHLVDFYDCLLAYLNDGPALPIAVYCVDEAQDITPLQWQVILKASARAEKIRIAGDPSQSLYSYAGATPETLMSLADRYNTINLEATYRLSRQICLVADSIIDLMEDKLPRTHTAVKAEEGVVKEYADREEFIRLLAQDYRKGGFQSGKWYVLFRCNHFIGSIADALSSYHIPYHTSKGFCIGKNILSRVRTYYNYRLDGFRSATKDAFAKKYQIKDFDAPFTDSLLVPGEERYVVEDYVETFGIDELERLSKEEPYCYLSTTYKVKGGEADNVAVFLDATKQVSENLMVDLDGELRVMYVACTRARENLYIIAPETVYNLMPLWESIMENMGA